MQTQCPDCSTVFRVLAEQLEAAEGLVRCGECGTVFNAAAALLAEPVPEAEHPQTAMELEFEAGEPEHPSHRFFLQDVEAANQHTPAARPRAWLMLNVALAIALAAQLAYAERDALANLPGVRPLMSGVCALAGCELEPRRELAKIALLDRNVYSHPNAAGALIISATIVNNASYAQPYPVLAVSMANVRGSTIASRDFAPSDYLPLADVQAGMTPGSPVSVALQVVDPGSDAMTFELDFR